MREMNRGVRESQAGTGTGGMLALGVTLALCVALALHVKVSLELCVMVRAGKGAKVV